MKKYQIVSKWNTYNALQILEIDSEPKSNSSLKIVGILIIAILGYCIFGGNRSSSQSVEQQHQQLVIPKPIMNMKDNPHAAEDLNTLSDL